MFTEIGIFLVGVGHRKKLPVLKCSRRLGTRYLNDEADKHCVSLILLTYHRFHWTRYHSVQQNQIA